MSERRLLGVLLGLTILAAPLHAQERERLARREGELTALLAKLEAEWSSRDSARFVDQRRTIVSAGGFHVAYPEWVATEARVRLPELMAERRERYGVAIDSLLVDTLFLWVDDSAAARDAPWSEVRWRMGSLHGTSSVSLRGETRADWVTWVASAALEQWARSIFDPELTRWVGSAGSRMEFVELRDGTVRELILTPSSRGRRCLDGEIAECGLLLELEQVADPLLQSYDPADYRGLVERTSVTDASGKARCVAGRELATCAEILRRPGQRPGRAVSGRVRQNLIAFAVERGGASAWLRASRSAGQPVPDQLAAMSGMPLDSLLSAWRGELQGERRATEAGSGPTFLMALAWSVIGALLFAWRYRWRHV